MLTKTGNPAWKRGFIREHDHVSRFITFTKSLDLIDPFLCTIVLDNVFGIYQYCVEQLVLFTGERCILI